MGHRVSTPLSRIPLAVPSHHQNQQHHQYNNHHRASRAITAALILCAASTHLANAASPSSSSTTSCRSSQPRRQRIQNHHHEGERCSHGRLISAFASSSLRNNHHNPLTGSKRQQYGSTTSNLHAAMQDLKLGATRIDQRRPTVLRPSNSPLRQQQQVYCGAGAPCFQFRRNGDSNYSAYVPPGGSTISPTAVRDGNDDLNLSETRRRRRHVRSPIRLQTTVHDQTDSEDEDENDRQEEEELEGSSSFDYAYSNPHSLSAALYSTNYESSPRVSGATSLQRYYKRIHYNDALLNRILKGRRSNSSRWRKRTRRAAASLGFSVCRRGIGSAGSGESGDILETSSTSTTNSVPPQNKLVGGDTRERDTSESVNAVDAIFSSRPVPPLSSSIKRQQPLPTTDLQSQQQQSQSNPTKKRKTRLTEEQYQTAKLEWAARYTSISTLRSTFGTNRNRFWGDFDTSTTRKLYNTLLPRALLGLYEMGLWSPTDLAPLAYEARLAAKKYARERCAVPGRLASMLYDGFRSWRDWGTWSVEGMSWEQVWYKYETQILEEMRLERDQYEFMYDDEDLEEEITAQICMRILEKSCSTNKRINDILLGENYEVRNNDGSKKLRRKNAERYLGMIAAKLEMDVQELLEENERQFGELEIGGMGDMGMNVTSVSYLPAFLQ